MEKEECIRAMITALITKEHCFLLGVPGTAKTLMIDTLKSAFKMRKFSWLLTKFTAPEEIFGPTNLAMLKKGVFERIPDGKLWDCEIAQLEEIFKASTAILNTFLFAMNERKAHNNGVMDIPLHTIFAPSNEVPQDPMLNAMYDRLTLRVEVDRIKERDNFEYYLRNYYNYSKLTLDTQITKKELNEVVEFVKTIPYEHQVSKIGDVWEAMEDIEVIPSDRKWGQSIKMLQATALMNGHDKVEDEDFDIFNNVLWNTTQQRKMIYSVLMKTVNPSVAKVYDMKDDVEREWLKFQKEVRGKTESEKTRITGDFAKIVKKYQEELKGLKDSKAKSDLEGVLKVYYKKSVRIGLGVKVEED